MTPIAAYFIFVANEHERAAEKARRELVRKPSIVDRLRALAAGPRSNSPAASAA